MVSLFMLFCCIAALCIVPLHWCGERQALYHILRRGFKERGNRLQGRIQNENSMRKILTSQKSTHIQPLSVFYAIYRKSLRGVSPQGFLRGVSPHGFQPPRLCASA